MKHRLNQRIFPFILGGLILVACSKTQQSDGTAGKQQTQPGTSAAKITFIELGSVNCIPCKAMQPVMASVDKKYGDDLKVIFYDVWTPEQKQYAKQYGIRIIPTQVFLDETGQEIYRHEGFFPEVELDNLLQSRGLVVQSAQREG